MEKILLTDRTGCKWTFEADGRLHYTKDNQSPQVLLNNASEEFDIITDENGCFHAVIQDSDGDMIYFTYDFVNWKKYTILHSKSGKRNMRGFKLFYHLEKVHCFYTLEFNGKYMLIHHIFSTSESGETPRVIDYTANGRDFSCAMEECGKVHIFYTGESGKAEYKIYEDGVYTSGSIPQEDDIKTMQCIYHKGIHLIYTASMKSYRTLIYFNPESRERKVINFSDSNITAFAIYGNKESIYIQWCERLRFYQCISENCGISFKKPLPISEPRGKRVEFIRIRDSANPYVIGADRCIQQQGQSALGIGKIHSETEKTYNKKERDEEMHLFLGELQRQGNEINRLRKIINGINEKLTELSKKSESNALGEINEENYKAFQNTDIDSINFENSKTFSKE